MNIRLRMVKKDPRHEDEGQSDAHVCHQTRPQAPAVFGVIVSAVRGSFLRVSAVGNNL